MTTDRKICSTYRGSLYPLLAPTCAAPNDTCMPAANSILAEMMELWRLGRGGQRQVRGLADRPPGVAHGGGDCWQRQPYSQPSRAREAREFSSEL